MKRIPYGNYKEEFREEAIKLLIEGGLSIQKEGYRYLLRHWAIGLRSLSRTSSEMWERLIEN